jgi:hypothetical protein
MLTSFKTGVGLRFTLRIPGSVKTNLSLVTCRSDQYYPFGSQAAAGDNPSVLGFASRPCDRFAFVED